MRAPDDRLREAIHLSTRGTMDCFVAFAPRNDVQMRLRIPAALSRPSCASMCPSEESRAQGKPGACCTRSLACKVEKAHERSHYRFSQTFRLSPREWLYGLLRALPGGAGLLSPSPADNSANLTPASRRQDHTTWPYALAFSSGVKSRLTPKRPSHPASNVRDDREAPLL